MPAPEPQPAGPIPPHRVPTLVTGRRSHSMLTQAREMASALALRPSVQEAVQARRRAVVKVATACSGCEGIRTFMRLLNQELVALLLVPVEVVFIWACENDPTCQKFIRQAFPDAILFANAAQLASGRAHNVMVPGQSVEIDVPIPDVLVSGIICAGPSPLNSQRRHNANCISERRAGTGETFWYCFDFVVRFGIKLWMIENVVEFATGVANIDSCMNEVIDIIEARDFTWAWRILDARHYGSCQRRRRLYIVIRHPCLGRFTPEKAAILDAFLEGDKTEARRLEEFILPAGHAAHDPTLSDGTLANGRRPRPAPKETERAQQRYIASGAAWPPPIEHARCQRSPLQWGLRDTAHVNLVGLSEREMYLIHWHVNHCEDVLSAPFASNMILNAERSWQFVNERLPRDECPTITAKCEMVLYATGAEVQLRWFSPRELWPMQGLSIELMLRRNFAAVARYFSHRQLISLAGSAFHMPSAAAFLTGVIYMDSF